MIMRKDGCLLDLGYAAFRYAFRRTEDGTLLRIDTTAKTRIFMMASIVNSMLQAGHSNDQVDWYGFNRYLALISDPEYNDVTVTSFQDFQRLYERANQGKERNFEGTVHYDEKGRQSIVINLTKRNTGIAANMPFGIERNSTIRQKESA